MCLIVHSDGHLDVKLLYEQIWPELVNGGLEIRECYDLILRSHASKDLECIYILSPHSVSEAGSESADPNSVFQLLDINETRVFDSIFAPPRRLSGGQYRLEFPRAIDESARVVNVTPLEPEIRPFEWPQGDLKVSAAFLGTGMTIAQIRFKKAKIKPYNPQLQGETTYWVRIAFKPKVNHVLPFPIQSGHVGDATLMVQPCQVLGANSVIENLTTQLSIVARADGFQDHAPVTQRLLIDDLLRGGKASTRIEDHRISLVVNETFLLLNQMIDGPCTFLDIQRIPRDGRPSDSQIVRTWLTGAKYYPETDALRLAYMAYDYLSHWAATPRAAKRKEDVTAAIAAASHSNVSHVVEALKEMKYLASEDRGRYFVGDRKLPGYDMHAGGMPMPEELGGPEDRELRDSLYGRIRIPLQGAETFSRFLAKSFKVHFDLAWWAISWRA